MFFVLVRITAVPLYPRAKVFAEWLGIEAGFEKDFDELTESEKEKAAEEFYDDCYDALEDCDSGSYECDNAFEVCKDVKRKYTDTGDFERIKTKVWDIINYYNTQIRFGRKFDEKIDVLELAYEIGVIEPYAYWFYLGEIYSDPDYSAHDYDRALYFLAKVKTSTDGEFYTKADTQIDWICWYTESQGISQPNGCKEQELIPEWTPGPLDVGDFFETFAEDHQYAGLELKLIIKEDSVLIAKATTQEIYFKLVGDQWQEIGPPVVVQYQGAGDWAFTVNINNALKSSAFGTIEEPKQTTSWSEVSSYKNIIIVGGPGANALNRNKCSGGQGQCYGNSGRIFIRHALVEGKDVYFVAGIGTIETEASVNHLIDDYIRNDILPPSIGIIHELIEEPEPEEPEQPERPDVEPLEWDVKTSSKYRVESNGDVIADNNGGPTQEIKDLYATIMFNNYDQDYGGNDNYPGCKGEIEPLYNNGEDYSDIGYPTCPFSLNEFRAANPGKETIDNGYTLTIPYQNK